MEKVYVKSAWSWNCPECGSLQADTHTLPIDGVVWVCTECGYHHNLVAPQTSNAADQNSTSDNTTNNAIALPSFDLVSTRVTASLIQEGYDAIDISIARRTHTIIGEILQEQQPASDNPSSTKLPTLVEVQTEFANQEHVATPTAAEYEAIKFAHNFIYRNWCNRQ